MPSIDVLVLYGNDSLYAKYDDGSTLQLSPCGSVFLYTESPPSLHKVQHLTRFATSNFKDKIMRVIHIRNQYAARPYLCKEILNSHLLNCTVSYILYSHFSGTFLKNIISIYRYSVRAEIYSPQICRQSCLN